MPAPALLSEPAIVRTGGRGNEESGMAREVRKTPIGIWQSGNDSYVKSMPETISELAGLHVTIDRVVYVPHLEAPPERPCPFVYFITIKNDSPETVTIRGRKWVVTDASSHRIVVEGDGVVGKFPRLEPGESFSYNSYHTIGIDSTAEGAFFGVTTGGTRVFTRIPPFEMHVPRC